MQGLFPSYASPETMAREAFGGSNNVSAALNDLALSGTKQDARALHRTAGKTIVSVSVLSHGIVSSPGGVCAAFGWQCLVLDTAQTTAFL